MTKDEAKKRAAEIPEKDREAVTRALLGMLTDVERTCALADVWHKPYEYGVEHEVYFPKSKQPPEKVQWGLSLGGGPRGVEVSFPDGRLITVSMAEWVSIALYAIDSAAYSQVVARNYQRKAYQHASYPLHEIRGAWDKVLKLLDGYTGDYGPGGKDDEADR
jgi:hypothetical protein